ncbi:hypothetical protein HanRHA438_Chr08g0350371 [Helianthus annuus]|nr:hypothetical protein HanRHA438_Chr08g0350371 [Helianthus annuus]
MIPVFGINFSSSFSPWGFLLGVRVRIPLRGKSLGGWTLEGAGIELGTWVSSVKRCTVEPFKKKREIGL